MPPKKIRKVTQKSRLGTEDQKSVGTTESALCGTEPEVSVIKDALSKENEAKVGASAGAIVSSQDQLSSEYTDLATVVQVHTRKKSNLCKNEPSDTDSVSIKKSSSQKGKIKPIFDENTNQSNISLRGKLHSFHSDNGANNESSPLSTSKTIPKCNTEETTTNLSTPAKKSSGLRDNLKKTSKDLGNSGSKDGKHQVVPKSDISVSRSCKAYTKGHVLKSNLGLSPQDGTTKSNIKALNEKRMSENGSQAKRKSIEQKFSKISGISFVICIKKSGSEDIHTAMYNCTLCHQKSQRLSLDGLMVHCQARCHMSKVLELENLQLFNKISTDAGKSTKALQGALKILKIDLEVQKVNYALPTNFLKVYSSLIEKINEKKEKNVIMLNKGVEGPESALLSAAATSKETSEVVESSPKVSPEKVPETKGQSMCTLKSANPKSYEKLIYSKYSSALNELVKLQKNRQPTKIILLTDSRNVISSPFESEQIKIYRRNDLDLDHAYDVLKQDEDFGKGVIYVILCGILSFVRKEIYPLCENKQCIEPVYILKFQNTCASLIQKALILHKKILLNTVNDCVLFCDLVPVSVEQYNKLSLSNRSCMDSHEAHFNLTNFSQKRYNLALYNAFVHIHSLVMGHSLWILDKERMDNKPEKTLPFPSVLNNGYTLSPQLEEFRNKLIHSYAIELLNKIKLDTKETNSAGLNIDLKSEDKKNTLDSSDKTSLSKRFSPKQRITKQKERIQQRKNIRKYSKIAVISNQLYKNLLIQFEGPKVCIMAEEELSTENLLKYLKKKKDFMPSDTMWIYVTGINFLFYEAKLKECIGLKCADPLTSLKQMEKISSQDKIDQTVQGIGHDLYNVTKIAQNGLHPDSGFMIFPPIPSSLVEESSLNHDDLHKLLREYLYTFTAPYDDIINFNDIFMKLNKKFCQVMIKSLVDLDMPHKNILGLEENQIDIIPNLEKTLSVDRQFFNNWMRKFKEMTVLILEKVVSPATKDSVCIKEKSGEKGKNMSETGKALVRSERETIDSIAKEINTPSNENNIDFVSNLDKNTNKTEKEIEMPENHINTATSMPEESSSSLQKISCDSSKKLDRMEDFSAKQPDINLVEQIKSSTLPKPKSPLLESTCENSLKHKNSQAELLTIVTKDLSEEESETNVLSKKINEENSSRPEKPLEENSHDNSVDLQVPKLSDLSKVQPEMSSPPSEVLLEEISSDGSVNMQNLSDALLEEISTDGSVNLQNQTDAHLEEISSDSSVNLQNPIDALLEEISSDGSVNFLNSKVESLAGTLLEEISSDGSADFQSFEVESVAVDASSLRAKELGTNNSSEEKKGSLPISDPLKERTSFVPVNLVNPQGKEQDLSIEPSKVNNHSEKIRETSSPRAKCPLPENTCSDSFNSKRIHSKPSGVEVQDFSLEQPGQQPAEKINYNSVSSQISHSDGRSPQINGTPTEVEVPYIGAQEVKSSSAQPHGNRVLLTNDQKSISDKTKHSIESLDSSLPHKMDKTQSNITFDRMKDILENLNDEQHILTEEEQLLSEELEHEIMDSEEVEEEEIEVDEEEEIEAEDEDDITEEAETEITAEAEVTTKAEAEITTEAEAEITAEAEAEITADAEAQITAEAGHITTEAEGHITTEAEPQITTEAEPHITTEAEPHITTEAEAHITAEAAHITAEAEAHITAEAEAHITAEAEAGITAEAEAGITAEAEAEITAEAEAEITAEAEAEITAEAEAEITAEAEAEITAEAEAEITAEAEAEIIAEAEAEITAEAEAEIIAEAEAEITAEAEAEITAEAEAEITAEAEAEITAEAEAEIIAEAEAEIIAEAEAEITAEAEAEITAEAEAEITAEAETKIIAEGDAINVKEEFGIEKEEEVALVVRSSQISPENNFKDVTPTLITSQDLTSKIVCSSLSYPTLNQSSTPQMASVSSIGLNYTESNEAVTGHLFEDKGAPKSSLVTPIELSSEKEIAPFGEDISATLLISQKQNDTKSEKSSFNLVASITSSNFSSFIQSDKCNKKTRIISPSVCSQKIVENISSGIKENVNDKKRVLNEIHSQNQSPISSEILLDVKPLSSEMMADKMPTFREMSSSDDNLALSETGLSDGNAVLESVTMDTEQVTNTRQDPLSSGNEREMYLTSRSKTTHEKSISEAPSNSTLPSLSKECIKEEYVSDNNLSCNAVSEENTAKSKFDVKIHLSDEKVSSTSTSNDSQVKIDTSLSNSTEDMKYSSQHECIDISVQEGLCSSRLCTKDKTSISQEHTVEQTSLCSNTENNSRYLLKEKGIENDVSCKEFVTFPNSSFSEQFSDDLVIESKNIETTDFLEQDQKSVECASQPQNTSAFYDIKIEAKALDKTPTRNSLPQKGIVNTELIVKKDPDNFSVKSSRIEMTSLHDSHLQTPLEDEQSQNDKRAKFVCEKVCQKKTSVSKEEMFESSKIGISTPIVAQKASFDPEKSICEIENSKKMKDQENEAAKITDDFSQDINQTELEISARLSQEGEAILSHPKDESNFSEISSHLQDDYESNTKRKISLSISEAQGNACGSRHTTNSEKEILQKTDPLIVKVEQNISSHIEKEEFFDISIFEGTKANDIPPQNMESIKKKMVKTVSTVTSIATPEQMKNDPTLSNHSLSSNILSIDDPKTLHPCQSTLTFISKEYPSLHKADVEVVQEGKTADHLVSPAGNEKIKVEVEDLTDRYDNNFPEQQSVIISNVMPKKEPQTESPINEGESCSNKASDNEALGQSKVQEPDSLFEIKESDKEVGKSLTLGISKLQKDADEDEGKEMEAVSNDNECASIPTILKVDGSVRVDKELTNEEISSEIKEDKIVVSEVMVDIKCEISDSEESDDETLEKISSQESDESEIGDDLHPEETNPSSVDKISKLKHILKQLEAKGKLEYNHIYIFGRRDPVINELGELFDYTFFEFDHSSWTSATVDEILKKIGSPKPKSICILMFELSFITKILETNQDCSRYNCSKTLNRSVLKNYPNEILHETTQFISELVDNLIDYLSQLSKHVPVLVMPLEPKKVYTDYCSSIDIHKRNHGLPSDQAVVVYGHTYKWILALGHLVKEWNRLLEKNQDYFPPWDLAKYTANQGNIFPINKYDTSFLTNWHEITKWKEAIMDILLTLNTEKLKGILESKESLPSSSYVSCVGNIVDEGEIVTQEESKTTSEEKTDDSVQASISTSKPPGTALTKAPSVYKATITNISDCIPDNFFEEIVVLFEEGAKISKVEDGFEINFKNFESLINLKKEICGRLIAESTLDVKVTRAGLPRSQYKQIRNRKFRYVEEISDRAPAVESKEEEEETFESTSEWDPKMIENMTAKALPKEETSDKDSPVESEEKKNTVESVYSKWEPQIIKNMTVKALKILNMTSFKTVVCPQNCIEPRQCLYYHSRADYRRNPLAISYGPSMCNFAKKGCHNRACSYSHNKFEVLLYPSHLYTAPCSGAQSRIKCFRGNPLCPKAHKDSSEMLFSNGWVDLLLFNMSSTFYFLAGTLRRFCPHDLRVRGAQVLLVGPSMHYLHVLSQAMQKICWIHHLNFAELTPAILKGESAHLILATPSHVAGWMHPLFNDCYTVVIVHKVDTIMADEQQRADFCRFWERCKMSNLPLSMIQKVFVADVYNPDLMRDIATTLNIALKEVKNPEMPPMFESEVPTVAVPFVDLNATPMAIVKPGTKVCQKKPMVSWFKLSPSEGGGSGSDCDLSSRRSSSRSSVEENDGNWKRAPSSRSAKSRSQKEDTAPPKAVKYTRWSAKDPSPPISRKKYDSRSPSFSDRSRDTWSPSTRKKKSQDSQASSKSKKSLDAQSPFKSKKSLDAQSSSKFKKSLDSESSLMSKVKRLRDSQSSSRSKMKRTPDDQSSTSKKKRDSHSPITSRWSRESPSSPYTSRMRSRESPSPYPSRKRRSRDRQSPYASRWSRDSPSPVTSRKKRSRDSHSPYTSRRRRGSPDSQSPFTSRRKRSRDSQSPFTSRRKMSRDSQSPFTSRTKRLRDSRSPFTSRRKRSRDSRSRSDERRRPSARPRLQSPEFKKGRLSKHTHEERPRAALKSSDTPHWESIMAQMQGEATYDQSALEEECFDREALCSELGAIHYREFIQEKSELNIKFEEEFKVYWSMPDMYSDFENVYQTFTNLYRQKYSNYNEEHEQRFWNSFWQSKFNFIRGREWKKRVQNLVQEFRAKYLSQRSPSWNSPSGTATKGGNSERRDAREGTSLESAHGSRSSRLEEETRRDEDSVIKETLVLLSSLAPRMGALGNSVLAIIQKALNMGATSPEALQSFGEPDTILLFDLAIKKLEPQHRSLVKGVLNNLVDRAKTVAPKTINLEAIAQATVGKDSVYTLNMIRAAAAIERIDASESLINEYYMRICELHFKMALQNEQGRA